MSTPTLNISQLKNGTLGLFCLGFVLAATNANASPCATNMSNGTGYNMSNASGHRKAADNYGGKKGGESSHPLNTHQSEQMRPSESTNMSNGTGHDISNASGHKKGGDNYGGKKGRDNYNGKKGGESSPQLNTEQGEQMGASESTNMSNGTGYNMSNASGHKKAGDNYREKKGGDNYGGKKGGEISRQLNNRQSESPCW